MLRGNTRDRLTAWFEQCADIGPAADRCSSPRRFFGSVDFLRLLCREMRRAMSFKLCRGNDRKARKKGASPRNLPQSVCPALGAVMLYSGILGAPLQFFVLVWFCPSVEKALWLLWPCAYLPRIVCHFDVCFVPMATPKMFPGRGSTKLYSPRSQPSLFPTLARFPLVSSIVGVSLDL